MKKSSSSIVRSSEVGEKNTAVVTEGRPPCLSLPVEDDDDDDVSTTTTAVKTEEVALSSNALVTAAGPVREGGSAAHRTAAGRNKRKGPFSPPSAEMKTDDASSPVNSSRRETTSWGLAERTPRTADDDVVV